MTQPGMQRRASGQAHGVCTWAQNSHVSMKETVFTEQPSALQRFELPPPTCFHTSLSFPANVLGGDLCNDFVHSGCPGQGAWKRVDSGQEESLHLPAPLTSTCPARHSGEVGPGPWQP